MSDLSSSQIKEKINQAFIHHKIALTLFAVLIVLITFFATFNWNWFRPFLVSYVSQKSGRDIKIGKMGVDFSGFLNPTIQFENLYIPNATWSKTWSETSSDKRPLIAAKKIAFKFNALQFIFNPEARIVHVALSDGEINLERLKDGLRNWRLLNPNYKGKGKYLVLSLTVQRSIIRAKNHALNLEFIAKIDPNLNPNSVSKKLPNSITFSGNYLKSPFNGNLLTESKITFQQTKTLFNVVGFLNQGKNKIYINGQLGDVFKVPLIDADFKITGNLFSLINIFSRNKSVEQGSFNASTHVVKVQNQYQISDFSGDINGSDLKGNVSYLDNKNAPQIKGDFTSEVIDFNNLLNLFNQLKKSDADLTKADLQTNSENAHSAKISSSKNNPIDQISTAESLKKSQLSVTLKVKKVANLNKLKFENLNLKASGNAGKYDIKIQDGVINGGKFLANAAMDINKDLPEFQANIMINQLKIENLIASEKLDNQVSAPLIIKVNAHSKGNSFTEVTANLFGDADVVIGKGVISNKLDAKLGLDFGKLVWLSLRGDKNIGLNCGKLGLDIKNGQAVSDEFWMNTQQTIVQGEGKINLVNKQLNVLLDPQPKDPTLFVNHKSIQISGQLDKADYAVKTTDKQLKKSAKNMSNYNCNSH